MSIASKLKDLVIKWGGQPTKDDDSIEELIALLTELDAPSGGSGALVVGLNLETGALDKTWQEIHDAAQNGVVCLLQPNGAVAYLTALVEGGESGKIVTPWGADFIAFQESTAKYFSSIATSPNDFPVIIEG